MNGPIAIPITKEGETEIALVKDTDVYTDAIDISGLDTFALTYKASCTGSPSIAITMEQGIVPPADNDEDDNFAAAVGSSAIESALSVTTIQHKAITPLAIKYIRFKLRESADTTDTKIVMHLNALNRFAI